MTCQRFIIWIYPKIASVTSTQTSRNLQLSAWKLDGRKLKHEVGSRSQMIVSTGLWLARSRNRTFVCDFVSLSFADLMLHTHVAPEILHSWCRGAHLFRHILNAQTSLSLMSWSNWDYHTRQHKWRSKDIRASHLLASPTVAAVRLLLCTLCCVLFVAVHLVLCISAVFFCCCAPLHVIPCWGHSQTNYLQHPIGLIFMDTPYSIRRTAPNLIPKHPEAGNIGPTHFNTCHISIQPCCARQFATQTTK